MLKMLKRNGLYKPHYANDVDVYIPEIWAMESIAILLNNMVSAQLVHRDYENELADFGDVVNVPKPSEFAAKRKHTNDNITIQDAISEKVQVALDQHVHVSFIIRDSEQSKSFKELSDEFLLPAMVAQAQFLDQIVLGQYVHFLDNSVGGFGTFNAANSLAYILAAREKLNVLKAPVGGRRIILTPASETAALSNSNFLDAAFVGDDGTSLREASLGRKLGFDFFMDQNAPTVGSGSTTSTGAINNASGYSAGTTVLTVDGITGIIATGTWLSLGNKAYYVVAHTETLGNTTEITINTGLHDDVADDDVITFYTPGAVNNAGGYDAGWAKEITVDGFTVAPKVGQAVTFGTTAANLIPYTIIEVNGTTGITLDRPLELAIADDDPVNVGPAGRYNLAFHRNAIALVVRPLVLPRAGTGARAGTQSFNGFSVRVVITYDAERQGTLFTIDMLCGIKVLDERLGVPILG